MELYSQTLQNEYGMFTVVCSNDFIIRLFFGEDNLEQEYAALEKQFGNAVVKSGNEMTGRCVRGLSAYFEKRLRAFTLPVLLQGTPFQEKIWGALCRVPYGQTVSYRQLGVLAGATGARAIGGAVGKNPIPIIVPCHRVIRSDGGLGGFSGGIENKKMLLRLENIPYRNLD